MATNKKMIALEETSQAIKTNTETIIGAEAGTRTVVDNIYKKLTEKRYRWGVRIDKNNSDPNASVEYLYDAVGFTPASVNLSTGVFSYGSWFDWFVITQNKPYMVNYDGTPAYQLDSNDYTKKADGTASDVSNTAFAGNAMAKFPIVWRFQYEDSNYQYDIFSNVKYDEHYEAYAFQRADGSYMPYRWHRMFKGAEVSGRLRSIAGLQPMYGKTAPYERAAAQANNPSGKQIWDMTPNIMVDLIGGLMRLISKSRDSQAKFGNGNLGYNSSASPTYGVKKTGTIMNKGQFYGTSASGTSSVQMKAFHCEGIYADQWERVLGYYAYASDNGIALKEKPPYTLDGTDPGYHYVNNYEPISGNSGTYITKTRMTQYGEIPYSLGGSSSTYACDVCWKYEGTDDTFVGVALRGGDCYDSTRCGVSAVPLNGSASYANWALGACLSCEAPEDEVYEVEGETA